MRDIQRSPIKADQCILSSLTEKRVYPLLKKLSRVYLLNDIPLLKDGDKPLAYLPTKQGLYFYVAIPTPEHEVAHLLEMNDRKRWTLNDFGINSDPPDTPRPLLTGITRETKVRAIQSILANEPPNPLWFKDRIWGNLLMNRISFPFRSFAAFSHLEDYLASLYTKTIARWDFDRIHYEWEERAEHLNHYMETSNAA